jgi:hypothetical protein
MKIKDNKLLSILDNSYLTTFGTVLLSIGCAFVGSYDNKIAWAKVTGNGAAEFIAYILTNPFVALVISIPFLIFSEIISNYRKKELEENNKNLEEGNVSIPTLKEKIDKSQEDLQALRSDIYELHQNHVRTWLKGIFKQIDFNTYVRASVYYENLDSFSLLARYSLNPALAKSHKQKFKLNQGVISQAWQHGEHLDNESLSYDSNPDKYNAYMMKKYKYSLEQLNEINMKSCTFFGLSITQADENIGVILFESLNADAFSPETIDKIKDYCHHFESHLCSFVRDGIGYDKSISVKKNSAVFNDVDAGILAELGDKNE